MAREFHNSSARRNLTPTSDDGPAQESRRKHFVVAVDFGTTFSSVAFAILNPGQRRDQISIDQVQMITNYPKAPNPHGDPMRDVPTETWYRERDVAYEDEDEDDESDEETEETYSTGRIEESEERVWSIEEGEVSQLTINERGNNSVSDDFKWGYMVQDTQRAENAFGYTQYASRRVTRAKLLLDTSQYTRDIREELVRTLKSLKARRLIRQNEDVITDFLTCLFQHTKKELTDRYRFTDDCVVELVLCVPAIWTAWACRIMHDAVATAMQRSGFGNTENGSVNNLFIVSEPEAASAYVLCERSDIKQDSSFVLLDAGGGTVDAITYVVDKSIPLRLKQEAVTPGGELCGSSYLNDRFVELVMNKLKDETYLLDSVNNVTLKSIIESSVMREFESVAKRDLDFTNQSTWNYSFQIRGLRPNKKKGIVANHFTLDYNDFEWIFRPCMKGAARLMRQQLDQARKNGIFVDKVILIGGFGDSPSLAKYLEKALDTYSTTNNLDIELLRPPVPGTSGRAVAIGAVLRALNKEDGPIRRIRSSYGVLRKEEYDWKTYPSHKGASAPRDKLDGRKYVSTIDWKIKRGNIVPPQQKFVIPVIHTFNTRKSTRFRCEEKLFVLDRYGESHYNLNNLKNKGYQKVGTLVVDMSFLRDQGLITPVKPNPGEWGKEHYVVEFDLVIDVDDRNMRYSARWPKGKDGRVVTGTVRQISIAAAFIPGTK